MKKIKNIENIVLEVLENNVQARKDDYILFLKVLEKVDKNILEHPFWAVMKHYKESGLPNWKTIERCRRKIQAVREDLRDAETDSVRKMEEQKYFEYSKGE